MYLLLTRYNWVVLHVFLNPFWEKTSTDPNANFSTGVFIPFMSIMGIDTFEFILWFWFQFVNVAFSPFLLFKIFIIFYYSISFQYKFGDKYHIPILRVVTLSFLSWNTIFVWNQLKYLLSFLQCKGLSSTLNTFIYLMLLWSILVFVVSFIHNTMLLFPSQCWLSKFFVPYSFAQSQIVLRLLFVWSTTFKIPLVRICLRIFFFSHYNFLTQFFLCINIIIKSEK